MSGPDSLAGFDGVGVLPLVLVPLGMPISGLSQPSCGHVKVRKSAKGAPVCLRQWVQEQACG